MTAGRGGRLRRAARAAAGIAFALLVAPGRCPASVSPQQSELMLFDEPVVVSAGKHAQPMHEVPASLTVITREDIRRLGYRTLGEALRSVNGFYVSDDRNYAALGVRGFLRPGDYDDRILLLVNGHTYNDDIYQEAPIDSSFGIPMEAIERIEVIRGPGAALYGGNAMFAVVNVITSTGSERPGVQALAETGSYGRKRAAISGGGVYEGLDVFASGAVLDLDGQEDLFYREFDAPETNHGIAHEVDGERALQFVLNAAKGGFRLQGGASTREKHIPTGSFGTVFGDPATATRDSRYFGEVGYTTTLPGELVTNARAYYDGYHYHGTYVYGSRAERTKNEDFSDSDWFGGELRVQRSIAERTTVVAGAEYSDHPSVRQRNFDIGGDSLLRVRKSFGTWALFAQDEWQMLDTLRLVLGIRYDRFYEGLDQVSPRAGILWTPLRRTSLKLLYGHAFRPPNQYELYYQVRGESRGNPELDSEDIDSFEIVFDQAITDHVDVEATAFHNEIGDLIDQVVVNEPATGQPVLAFENGSDLRSSGGGLEIRGRLPHEVATRIGYAFQDTRSRGGRTVSNSPKHLGYGSLLFPVAAGVEGGAELVIVGPRLTLLRRHVPTVTLANVNIIVPTPIRGFELTAGLYNVLNQKYSDPGGAEHVQDRIAQDRFNYRVQAGYRW